MLKHQNARFVPEIKEMSAETHEILANLRGMVVVQ
jgi:hypothetical protein